MNQDAASKVSGTHSTDFLPANGPQEGQAALVPKFCIRKVSRHSESSSFRLIVFLHDQL